MLNAYDKQRLYAAGALLAFAHSNYCQTRAGKELEEIADNHQEMITNQILMDNKSATEAEADLFFANSYEKVSKHLRGE